MRKAEPPPRGYRLLGLGETTQIGDLCYSVGKREWQPTMILGARIEQAYSTIFARKINVETNQVTLQYG